MWQQQQDENATPAAIPTLLRQLDASLGGIRKACITEICGPAGVGKSTLASCAAVQCASPRRFGGLDSPVIVIDTELKFSAERLAEIALSRLPTYFGDSVAGRDRIRNMLGKVTVLQARTAKDLDARMRNLEDGAARTGAGLIIFDSVAALARDGFGAGTAFARVARLNRHAAQLKRIAESLGIAVLVTNQVSGRAPRIQPAGRGSAAAERPASTWVLPALGVVWTHAVNVRVLMDVSPVQPKLGWDGFGADSRGGGGDSSTYADSNGGAGVADPTLASSEAVLRRIHVVKSPACGPVVVPYVITDAGIVDPPVELIAALPPGSDIGSREGRQSSSSSSSTSGDALARARAPVGVGGRGG